MSLTDVMSAAQLTLWTEIATGLAMVTFVAIAIWTFARRNRRDQDEAKMLPLADDAPRPERNANHE